MGRQVFPSMLCPPSTLKMRQTGTDSSTGSKARCQIFLKHNQSTSFLTHISPTLNQQACLTWTMLGTVPVPRGKQTPWHPNVVLHVLVPSQSIVSDISPGTSLMCRSFSPALLLSLTWASLVLHKGHSLQLASLPLILSPGLLWGLF